MDQKIKNHRLAKINEKQIQVLFHVNFNVAQIYANQNPVVFEIIVNLAMTWLTLTELVVST